MTKFFKNTYVEFTEDYIASDCGSPVYFCKGKRYKLNRITETSDGMTIYDIEYSPFGECSVTKKVFNIIEM